MLEVPRILVSVSFQSNDVSGAQYSELLFYYNTMNDDTRICVCVCVCVCVCLHCKICAHLVLPNIQPPIAIDCFIREYLSNIYYSN